MRAVGLNRHLPIDHEDSLLDLELEEPRPRPRDLVVKVRAIAVNPVDTKVRGQKSSGELLSQPRILGWDAAGEVVAVGSEAQGFAVGDRVYYAGDLTRPGTNSELQAVDSRVVGHMPRSLAFHEAAALPLTTLTAWEALFDRLRLSPAGEDAGRSLLVVGGAGGVGSIAIQLAARLARLRVIATASRPESRQWARELGAEAIIDHGAPLDEGLRAVTPGGQVDFILCSNKTDEHWGAMARAIAPQGTIASIVETRQPVDLGLLKNKSAGFVWEFMFTRSMFETPDIAEQGRILSRVAELVDAGTLRSTVKRVLSPISAQNLKEAHALLEAGHTTGKIVLEGWG